MSNAMSSQLFALKLACIQHERPAAQWVYEACVWYVTTGRNSLEFDKAFCKLTGKRIASMIDYCLSRDTSTDGIMRSVKKYCKVRTD